MQRQSSQLSVLMLAVMCYLLHISKKAIAHATFSIVLPKYTLYSKFVVKKIHLKVQKRYINNSKSIHTRSSYSVSNTEVNSTI